MKKSSVSLTRFAASSVRKLALAVGACAISLAAHADVVFNSISGQQGFNQCFQCFDTSGTYPTNQLPAIAELGDIIQFGGTARNLTSVSVGLAQTPYFDPRTSPYTLPYTTDVLLKLYTVDGSLSTSLIASRSLSIQILGDGKFNLTFDFTGVTVPNQIYYGLSFANSSSVSIAGLRFALWDYYPTAFGGDGALPVGTDPNTTGANTTGATSKVYGRMAANPSVLVSSDANGLGVNDLGKGFTPAVRFDAVNGVPEPGSVALVLAGLLAAGSVRARRRA